MTLKLISERSQSSLKFTIGQFWYKLLCYESVNPTIKISLLHGCLCACTTHLNTCMHTLSLSLSFSFSFSHSLPLSFRHRTMYRHTHVLVFSLSFSFSLAPSLSFSLHLSISPFLSVSHSSSRSLTRPICVQEHTYMHTRMLDLVQWTHM